jgi:hypothetical protein
MSDSAPKATIIRALVGGGQVFYCPGCQCTHAVNSAKNGPRWTYNNNADSPTFTPSILVTTKWSANDRADKDDVCHSFVTAGRIQFLGDCTHALAGQTVELPAWPYAPNTYGGIEDETP